MHARAHGYSLGRGRDGRQTLRLIEARRTFAIMRTIAIGARACASVRRIPIGCVPAFAERIVGNGRPGRPLEILATKPEILRIYPPESLTAATISEISAPETLQIKVFRCISGFFILKRT